MIAVRSRALVALLVLSTACRGSSPVSPTGRNEPTPPRAPSPLNFPPPSGAARVFTFDHELSYPVSDLTKTSRFVLYENGVFVLDFSACNCGEGYRGGFTETNGVITFEWEGWNIMGPWGATGRLDGDTLAVQYNLVMQLSDFEDGVYRRTH